MPHIKRSAIVECSSEALFDLVNDIEHYPEFLPWCLGATVQLRSTQEVIAALTVGKAGIKQTFKTRNVLDAPAEMQMHLLEGPFKFLKGVWHFQPLTDEACKVSFDLQFEFNNKLTAIALGSIFDQAADTLVDAFCKRVRQLKAQKVIT